MSNKFLDDAGVIYLFSKVKERDYQSDFELGYYDTITENDDESYTITRQTGYLVLDGVENKFIGGAGSSDNGVYYTNILVDLIEKPSSNNVVGNIICNLLKTNSYRDIYFNSIYGIAININGNIGVGLTTAITTLDEANAYLVQNPISIQYKLATATTERVEKNHYARYNQDFILEHNKSEAERSATEGKVVHEKELVDNYITETEINDKLYNYLKVNENGSVLLSSGPLQIFYTDIDFSIYSEQRPNNIINSGDLDVYFFDTGITCRDYEADKYYKYSFPAKSGTFAMTSDIPSALAIDSELSSTSTNSVQNKVINSALDGKANKTDITDMAYVVDSSDNAVSLETYGTEGYYVVPTKTYVDTQLTDKQDKLVSGTNIKTINGSTILGSGDMSISGTIPIYGVSQLYKHDYTIEAQPSGDTIYVTCWSTQNTKILLKDITRYAFSNVQVYNYTNGETIQVIKWDTTGFNYIGDNGTIEGNGYTVINYYINGEPTTY